MNWLLRKLNRMLPIQCYGYRKFMLILNVIYKFMACSRESGIQSSLLVVIFSFSIK